MIKKVLLFALVVFPVLSFAQEKIAYVDYLEVIQAMPEVKIMQDSLQKAHDGYVAEMKTIQDDYTKRFQEFVEIQETLTESSRLRREQELQSLRTTAENFEQNAGQQLQEMQQRLLIPIHTKLQKAVEGVAAENNFLYVLDSQAVRYASPSATNATPLVKRKLGI